MSTILSADDLNDFIAPGVACIKPVEIEKSSETAEIEIGIDGVPVEKNEKEPLKQAQISLTDCLACSGCITSAEAVLVELQSPKELLRELETDKAFAVSISPQSRISFARAYDLTVEQVDRKLTWLFSELGFSFYVGTEVGRIVSLEQTFMEATELTKKPILCSACPGWTLYAEKTHPHVLPYLSRVKSPQQITGNLLKQTLVNEGYDGNKIFHLSIMPCFDKKLESARPDNQMDGVKEVDLVLTAKELVQLVAEKFNLDFSDLPETDRSMIPQTWPNVSFASNLGSSSGGYLWYILYRLQMQHPGSEIRTIHGKNSDVVEYQLVDGDDVLFRGSQVYGFRNIQNLVRKLKPGKKSVVRRASSRVAMGDPADNTYIELMACPGGCINGGGQISPPEGMNSKLWSHDMNELYSTLPKLNVEDTARSMHLNAEVTSSVVETSFKPLEKDTSVPEALVVGSQW